MSMTITFEYEDDNENKIGKLEDGENGDIYFVLFVENPFWEQVWVVLSNSWGLDSNTNSIGAEPRYSLTRFSDNQIQIQL